MYYSPQHYT